MKWAVEDCGIAEKWRTVLHFGSCMILFHWSGFRTFHFMEHCWHELMGGVLWPLSGRGKMFYTVDTSQPRVLKITLKTLDMENGEGCGSQYTKYRNLSRTSYKNHELSPTFSAACVEQMAQSEEIGTAFLMTLKFWVANWKIWSTGDVFIYFSMWWQWLWKRREALKTNSCLWRWCFKKFFWPISFKDRMIDFWQEVECILQRLGRKLWQKLCWYI